MLVVNADDLGLSESVDRAILRAHRDGVVRSTSLLVTFPRAAEAAALARAESRLEVGLHIDLVEGTPVSDPASVRTLVGRDGRFLGLRELLTRLASARVRPAELATEIRAQVARARALGTPALAWDSHRHVHLFPLAARVVGAVAREQGARWVRRGAPAGWPGAWKAALIGAASAGSGPFLRGIPGADWYVDITSRTPPPQPSDLALLAAHPGLGEISAHPGLVNGADDPLAARRPLDLALLTDPLVVSAIGTYAVRWRVLA